MSTADSAAKLIKSLESRDWKILHVLERAMPKWDYVPLPTIAEMSRLHRDEVQYRLGELAARGLVGLRGPSYSLLTVGLDSIALNAHVRKNSIAGLGSQIGVGKESDVYEVITDSGQTLALKFYRIGRTSFRSTSRYRSYGTAMTQHRWLMICVDAARKEYEAIRALRPLGVSVPEVLAHERHSILMEKLPGAILANWKEMDDPHGVLHDVLTHVRLAFIKGNIINADLSEFNVVYDGERAVIIDWPQAVKATQKDASRLLERDVHNILKFFRRRFGAQCPEDSAGNYVKGISKRIWHRTRTSLRFRS